MSVAATKPSDSTASAGALLDVRDLCVSFRDDAGWVTMLNRVGFTVKRGETLGIVGESGCGKSLTALSVMGLLPKRGCQRTGAINFDGRNLAAIGEGEMRNVRGRQIGMVFQEPMSALDPVFTVGDQITETVRTHFSVGQREARERTIEALASVHIPAPAACATLYPMSLSGGMRQRVMIAMALVCEPKLLIADEPTTALDVTIQAQIMELLLELGRRTGTALLFITHNLGLVAESCERMITMYAGEVVEDGPVEAILGRPLHPYTAGLLESLPGRRAPKSRLPSIPGRVPSARDMPAGCRFSPRCNYAVAACQAPQRLAAKGDRHVRCGRAEELALAGSAG